jgi:8-hydroxy-5-deazaflavin:NADPH oxidoreductase
MRLAVIGTGKVGTVLATRFSELDHQVSIGTRNVGSEKISQLEKATGGRGIGKSITAACADSDVIFLAIPFAGTESIIRSAGDLSAKILCDCTNPLEPTLSGLTIGFNDSAGECVARWAGPARVVKALNTTGSGNMLNPQYGGQALSMFLCGDDPEAKNVVSMLVAELGFEPVDVGRLTQSRYLEPLAMLWITMAYQYKYGPDFGFRMVKRSA